MSKSKTNGRLSGVRWEMTATGITLSGNTYSFKETIKTLGGTWTPATKTWLLPVGTDLTFLQPPPRPAPRPREEWTREEWQNYLAYSRNRGGAERCCSHAVAFFPYDVQGPLCYDCPRHGKTMSSYTGD